jgi:hypothetical protein
LEIFWRLLFALYELFPLLHSLVQLAEIGRTWTYYIAKSDSSPPMVDELDLTRKVISQTPNNIEFESLNVVTEFS